MMVYLDSMFHVGPERAVDERTIDSRGVDGGMPVGEFTPIGWQAHEIIASILEETSPDLAEVQWRLRKYLAAHPGSPERALLAHLMETSELVNHGTA